MKPLITCLAVIISLSLAAAPAAAQPPDAPPEGCDLDAWFAGLAAERSLGTFSADMASLRDVYRLAGLTLARCSGLYWEGGPESRVILVEIPRGIYRAVFTTTEYGAVELDTISGQCGRAPNFSRLLFNVASGEAARGAEALLGSTGCTAVLSTSNHRAPWTLWFERLN